MTFAFPITPDMRARLDAPTRLISITEPTGDIHTMEYRTGDMCILYTEREQALLATGRMIFRKGGEAHVDLMARAEWLATQRGSNPKRGLIREWLVDCAGLAAISAVALAVYMGGA